MTPLRIRFLLFIFGCILTRSLFTIFTYYAQGWILKIAGMLAILPVIGWFYIIFVTERNTGPEVLGGTIWWQKLRPIHMLLWGFFAYLAINENRMAFVPLAIDTVFGLVSFLVFHYSNGDLKKML